MRPSVLCERSLIIAGLAALAACGGTSPGPTPPPCTYAVSASVSSFAAGGGSASASVSTAAGCTWTARADAPWMTIASGATGTGPGSVTFTVAANPDTPRRSGTLTIGGQVVSIEQEGATVPCTFAISPQGASMTKDGGTGSFSIATGPACSWSAVSESPWVTVTSGASGTGNGTTGFAVARNDQPAGRTGIIRAAGQPFSVAQAGDVGACQYTVAPIEFAPCMTTGELASQITAPAGCPWTAAPGASWIAVTSGSSGSGAGTVRFKVADNWDAPRNGTVMIRWPTPTAGQNLLIAQAGCRYAVSQDTFTFTAAGGSGTFDVLQQSEPYTCGGPLQNACLWSASSNAGWLTVTSSMPRSGDDRVNFTVAANPTGATRTATISVRDRVVRVTQGG